MYTENKVRTCSINSGGIGIPSHKPAHWKVSPISAIRKDNLNTQHCSQHLYPDLNLLLYIWTNILSTLYCTSFSENICLNKWAICLCGVYIYKHYFHKIHSKSSYAKWMSRLQLQNLIKDISVYIFHLHRYATLKKANFIYV